MSRGAESAFGDAAMKLACGLFFGLLYYAHQVSDLQDAWREPMCSFREGQLWGIGFGLFVAVALVGLIYALDLRRKGLAGEASNAISFGVLLLIVAVTPPTWATHNAAAAVLLGSIFLYFVILLHGSHPRLLIAHLWAPLLLAVGTGLASYGVWQKSLICYLVLAAMVHHHCVMWRASTSLAPAAAPLSSERRVRAR